LDIVFSVSGRRQDHTNQIFHFLPPTGSFFRYAYHGFLQEQPILSLDDLHRSRALLVIVRYVIDSGAHGIARKVIEAGSLRVAFVIVFLVVLVLFVFFLVWLFSKEHIGSYRA
jgi:hypothetical protein